MAFVLRTSWFEKGESVFYMYSFDRGPTYEEDRSPRAVEVWTKIAGVKSVRTYEIIHGSGPRFQVIVELENLAALDRAFEDKEFMEARALFLTMVENFSSKVFRERRQ